MSEKLQQGKHYYKPLGVKVAMSVFACTLGPVLLPLVMIPLMGLVFLIMGIAMALIVCVSPIAAPYMVLVEYWLPPESDEASD